ncbi:unnamed protein product [Alopecurus aequalis]
MGESHHRLGHFVGTDLFRSSSLTVRLGLEDAPCREPLLLKHKFSWKHLQDPGDSVRLEEFNAAVRMLKSGHHMDNSVAESHGVDRKRKARKICHEVPAVAPEKVAIAVQSEIVDSNTGGGGGQERKARLRVTFFCGKGRGAENGRDRASSPEKKTGGCAGDDVAAAACARISKEDVRSLSISAPADVVFGDGNHTDPVIGEHHEVPAPGSGKVCTGDQKTGPSSSPESSGYLSPPKKSARGCRVTFRFQKGIDTENGRERARPGKTDGRAGDVGAPGCAGISIDEESRLPSISAPADVVCGDGAQTDPAVGDHHQVSAPTSGKVCADDQETGPISSPDSSVDLTPSPRAEAAEALEVHSPAAADDARTENNLTSPLEAYLHVPAPASSDVVGTGNQDSGSSSRISSDGFVPAVDDYTGGSDFDLQMLGQSIAMEMDDDDIRSEVERQFGADRQRRAARRRAVVAPAPPMRFSLRLSDEEVMEDIAAVSVQEDVEREAPRKRRRGG